MNSSLNIIIVTYNATKWIDKCFANFVDMPQNWEVVVVDNNSSDGTVNILKQNYPFVKIIQSDENLGFAKANNVGLARALKNNVDNVLLLNQDAWISVDDIKKLIELQNKNPEYYILSPLHYNGAGTDLDCNFSKYLECCGELFKDYMLHNIQKEIYSTNYCNAAIWLLSRDCLKNIGGFNPTFYHYAEDDNYLHRLFYHGGKLGLVPTIKGFHDREKRQANPKFFGRLNLEYRVKILLDLSNPNLSNEKLFTKVFYRYLKSCIFYLMIFRYDRFNYKFEILSKYIKIRKEMYSNLIKSKQKQANFIEKEINYGIHR